MTQVEPMIYFEVLKANCMLIYVASSHFYKNNHLCTLTWVFLCVHVCELATRMSAFNETVNLGVGWHQRRRGFAYCMNFFIYFCTI